MTKKDRFRRFRIRKTETEKYSENKKTNVVFYPYNYPSSSDYPDLLRLASPLETPASQVSDVCAVDEVDTPGKESEFGDEQCVFKYLYVYCLVPLNNSLLCCNYQFTASYRSINVYIF